MENPTTEQTGGLPLVKGEALAKSGLNVLGNKGVALGMDDSASIRDYLQQMINQRQAYKGSFEQGMDQMRSVLGSTQNEMAQNMQAQRNRELTNDQDVFNMRVNMAQLKTQEERLMQEKMQQAENSWNFQNAIRQEQGLPPLPRPAVLGGATPQAGGVAPAPQDVSVGATPAPQGGEAPVAGAPAPRGPSNISPTQAATLAQMYANPASQVEAQKQLLALTKKDDIERRLESAGIVRGSPQWNQIMALNVAGAGAFTPHDVRTAGGTQQQTPFNAVSSALGPTPPAAVPASVQAPAAQGASVQAPAPVQAPAAAPIGAVSAPQAGVLAPSSKEGLELQKEREAIPIAAAKQEALKVAETAAKEQEQHSADVKEAQNNSMIAQSMQKDIRKADTLLGKLAGGGAQSAFFGLIDGGIQVGTLGSVNLPRFTEAVVKMDPRAKDPAVMDAYVRVAQNVEGLKLAYTRKVFQGQGSVTENERKLISTAVGDVNHMSPANLMRMAKATEIEARNKMDQDRLWSQMKDAGRSWNQFKSSPELKEMQRQQFYRTAKTFGVTNAVYPGDEQR
jgi:hypothetical protein